MYLMFSEKEGHYWINKIFGYAISSVLTDLYNKKMLTLVSESKKKEDDITKIHQQLADMMIFSSHYFEDSLYYKKYMEAYHGFFETMQRNETYLYWSELKNKTKDVEIYNQYKRYMEDLENEADKKSFEKIKPLLINSNIKEEEIFCSSDFFLEDKPVFYHLIKRTLTLIENGEKREFPLITKKLVSVFENNKFVHVEPCHLDDNYQLEYPKTEKSAKEDKVEIKNDLTKSWLNSHYETIDDAIMLGVIRRGRNNESNK